MIDITTVYDCIKDSLKETFQKFADENGLVFEYTNAAYHVVDYPSWYVRFTNGNTGKRVQREFDTTMFATMAKMSDEYIQKYVCEPFFEFVRKELLEVEHE